MLNSCSSAAICRRRRFCTSSARAGWMEMTTFCSLPVAARASSRRSRYSPTRSGLSTRPTPRQVGQSPWVRSCSACPMRWRFISSSPLELMAPTEKRALSCFMALRMVWATLPWRRRARMSMKSTTINPPMSRRRS